MMMMMMVIAFIILVSFDFVFFLGGGVSFHGAWPAGLGPSDWFHGS